MAKQKKITNTSKTPARLAKYSPDRAEPHLYTLKVFLIGGPVTKKFATKHPTVYRTIQIRGDQT